MKNEKIVKAYKVVAKDGKWSIILSYDEDSASELYQEDNSIEEDYIDRIEVLDLSNKIPNIYNGKIETIERMSKGIAFFPRCILEKEDLSELLNKKHSDVK